MTEQTHNPTLPDGEAQPASSAEPKTAYRWRYADQVAHDATLTNRKSHRGVLTYALVLGGAFLVSFAILITVLLLTGSTPA